MKIYIISSLFTIMFHPLFCQSFIYDNDSLKLNRDQQSLEKVIDQSDYIIEAIGLSYDYQYLTDVKQRYFIAKLKVLKVIRGINISIGDTVLAILNKTNAKENIYIVNDNAVFKSDESDTRYGNLLYFHYASEKISCLFLIDAKFPFNLVPDSLSQFKITSFINSTAGYFMALYDSEINGGQKAAVRIKSVIYNSRSEWYDYLKTFPDINLPKQ